MHAQGVIVEFDYGYEELDRLHDLELRLIAAIDEAGVGEYDGHEIAMDGTDGTLYMYGPDADSLFAVVRPLLESSNFMQGATAALQYGPHDQTTPVKFVIIGD